MNMNTIYALIFLATCVGVMADESIPARNPEIGESRPAWWLSLWMDHVLVIKGTTSWNSKGDPEIEIKFDSKVMENVLGKEDAELLEMRKHFSIGTIKIDNLLFASPGITLTDLGIENAKEMKFLIPVRTVVRGGKTFYRRGKGSEGIHIFSYGSMLLSPSLVYEGMVPDEGAKSADAVFQYRNKFDHIIPNKRLGEQEVGTEQPATPPELKSEDSDKPQPEAEGRSR